jgi:hypothetical protein
LRENDGETRVLIRLTFESQDALLYWDRESSVEFKE